MKEVFLPILAAAAFIIIVGVGAQGLRTGKIGLPTKFPDIVSAPQVEIKVDEIDIAISIADDSEERALGLSGRESLEEGTGLLFVFDEQNVRPKFWMKDMNFAIDIIWIDNNAIVQIDKEVPNEDSATPDKELKLYLSNQPVDYVLEVNSGFSESNDIEVGDAVDLRGLL